MKIESLRLDFFFLQEDQYTFLQYELPDEELTIGKLRK